MNKIVKDHGRHPYEYLAEPKRNRAQKRPDLPIGRKHKISEEWRADTGAAPLLQE